MKCTQKSQLTSFPKVRVLKKRFRHFNDQKEFRNDGTLHLFSLMALYSYANFRSNTKTVNGWRFIRTVRSPNCAVSGRKRSKNASTGLERKYDKRSFDYAQQDI